MLFSLATLGGGSLLFKKEPPSTFIPIISFEDGEWGYIEAEIEDKKYLLKIDTGGSDTFSLLEASLNTLKNKQQTGELSWADIHGKRYTSPLYQLSPIHVGPLVFSEFPIKVENPFFYKEGGDLNPSAPPTAPKRHHGRIGARFFRAWPIWYIDFSLGRIYPLHTFDPLNPPQKLPPGTWVEASLEPASPHFVVAIETPLGRKKFALDSAANASILRPIPGQPLELLSLPFFKIQEHDFGTIEILLYPLPEEFADFDGFLGIDFLKQYPFCLDSEHQKIFFLVR